MIFGGDTLTTADVAVALGKVELGDASKVAHLDKALHNSSTSSSYWYSSGFNIPAIISWTTGLIVGLLFTSTSIFTGPFVSVVGGIDLSFTSSALVGAIAYYALTTLFPYRSREVSSEVAGNIAP